MTKDGHQILSKCLRVLLVRVPVKKTQRGMGTDAGENAGMTWQPVPLAHCTSKKQGIPCPRRQNTDF